MLKIMFQKMWHKKWMISCILLGIILLTATVVSFPLYRKAAYDRMLQDEFENALRDSGEWPAKLEMTLVSKQQKGGKSMTQMEGYLANLFNQIGATPKVSGYYYRLDSQELKSAWNRGDMGKAYTRLGMLNGLPEHVTMVYGSMYSEDGLDEDGNIEVVISDACMVRMGFLLNEVLQFVNMRDAERNPISVKICGVYKATDEDDFYWQKTPDEYNENFMMSETLFRQMFCGENAGKFTIYCQYFALFDYTTLDSESVKYLEQQTNYIFEEGPFRKTLEKSQYRDILKDYNLKQDKIGATLVILQIPILCLLAAFLVMISSQIYEMEQNEISVYKSRGASGKQIFRLYLYQNIFLSIVGAIAGVPLGVLFCKLLGSTRNFLEFDASRMLEVDMSVEVIYYTLAAILAVVLIMTLPTIKHSRVTIVNLKQKKAAKKRRLWEICCLDVITLGVALYGFYNFKNNAEAMAGSVLEGKSLDPLLYLSSSLFIVGMGLLFLRVQPYLIRLIYLIGKRNWGPANYASFMENMKSNGKQQFIMLFMILTISLGMYHATVARTILQNATENASYLSGADIILKETWSDNAAYIARTPGMEFQYYEPEYGKFSKIEGYVSSTKVIYDRKATAFTQEQGSQQITLMGIDTKEFGQNTYVEDGLQAKFYYEYLNDLATAPEGVLVSKNFADKLGYKQGDKITYENGDHLQASGVIVGFFEFWPGYEPVLTELTPDGKVQKQEHFLLVAHYSSLVQSWGATPYEVWITVDETGSDEAVYDWVQENRVKVSKYENKNLELKRVEEDPLLQGTNGILTMGFIVTIILCAAGYLIYWIMSIRSREMMFGILRACGMHKSEVFHILINEQIFYGLLSILSGIGIGKLTSNLFVPLLQSAYQADTQVLPLRLISETSDMLRLYGVVICVMAVCLSVLIGLVFKLNISKALKLGEE